MADEQRVNLEDQLKVQRQIRGATGTVAKQAALLPSLSKRYNKSDIVDCIYRCCGVRTQICVLLDCSQKQLEYWLRKNPDAQADMVAAKEGIISKAEEVIIGALSSADEGLKLDAAKHVLKIYGHQQPSQQVNVQINAGSKEQQIKAIFGIAAPPSIDDED